MMKIDAFPFEQNIAFVGGAQTFQYNTVEPLYNTVHYRRY